MIPRILLILFLICTAIGQNTFATPQMPNILIHEGKEYPIDDDPMWEYFEKHREQRPKGGGRMSALWRGYLSFFEFRQKDLFLKDLKIFGGMEEKTGYGSFRWQSVFTESFGKANGLRVDWHSGLIVARYGENLHRDPYDIFEFRNQYASYAIFEIKSGVLVDCRFFDNKTFQEFSKKQFSAFQNTPEFTEVIKKLGVNGRKLEDSEAMIKDSLFSYTKAFLVK